MDEDWDRGKAWYIAAVCIDGNRFADDSDSYHDFKMATYFFLWS